MARRPAEIFTRRKRAFEFCLKVAARISLEQEYIPGPTL